MPAETQAYRPGDLVQLRSGGPTMTVGTAGAAIVFCQWFDKSGQLQGGNFAPAVLAAKADAKAGK